MPSPTFSDSPSPPPPSSTDSSSPSLSLCLPLFLACKSTPVQSQLLQHLAWNIQPHTLTSLPSLQFLLQCTTLDAVITSHLSTLTSLSPSPITLIQHLCSYIKQMSACHPSFPQLNTINTRLSILFRYHSFFHFLSSSSPHSDVLALLLSLFPSTDTKDEAEIYLALLSHIQHNTPLTSLHSLYPYSSFLSLWSHYYSLCQLTPTFTDMDREVKSACVEVREGSPRPPSPVPKDLTNESEPVVLNKGQWSVRELYDMLKEARQGWNEAQVKQEWATIINGTHPDIVRWRAHHT